MKDQIPKKYSADLVHSTPLASPFFLRACDSIQTNEKQIKGQTHLSVKDQPLTYLFWWFQTDLPLACTLFFWKHIYVTQLNKTTAEAKAKTF